MEREHEEIYEDVYTYYPIFSWKQCSKCGKDFIRETMWKKVTGPWIGNKGREYFLCKKCAPTIEEANRFFVNKEFLPKKPSIVSPAPPPKRLKRY